MAASDDALNFIKQNAGKGLRSSWDPEDTHDDGGDNLQYEEVLKEPKHRAKQKKLEVSGDTLTSTVPGSRKTTPHYCFNANGNQGHPKASHIFHTPASSTSGSVGYALCPSCLSTEQEHLANWRKDNVNTYVKQPEPITPEVSQRHHNELKGMNNDVRALTSSMMVFKYGVHPDAPEAAVAQETAYAGPGRTPSSNKPTATEQRTPEFKENALNAALERSRSGVGGRTPKELEDIGKEQEKFSLDNRDNSKYAKTEKGNTYRVYPKAGEASKGRIKGPAVGNYVKKTDSQPITTPLGEGNAPIDRVVKAGKEQGPKANWKSIAKEYGEGIVTPAWAKNATESQGAPKSAPGKQESLPIPKKAGAYASYVHDLVDSGQAADTKDTNEDDWYSYVSRNSEFKGGLDH